MLGFRIVPKMTAATAMDVIAVDEKITWNKALPRRRWFANTASASPRKSPMGTATTTKIAVDLSESKNSELVTTWTNWWRPHRGRAVPCTGASCGPRGRSSR